MDIREYLKKNTIVADGAMGTYYEELVALKQDKNNYPNMPEKANISHPDIIKEIHKQYLKAGANLIRTNTFAVNRAYFDSYEDIRENIKNAKNIAKMAIEEVKKENHELDEDIYIAGDIGTIIDFNDKSEAEIIKEYKQLADIFIYEGFDIILFETQAELSVVNKLSEYIKEKNPQIFIMASFAFNKTGYTNYGMSINAMLKSCARSEAIDAYGFNCAISAGHLYNFLKNQEFYCDKPVMALPNSSYPNVLRGKIQYAKNIPYFVSMEMQMAQLGIKILGGCCGTTPEYIKEIKKELGLIDKESIKPLKITANQDIQENKKSLHENRFMQKINRGEKVVIVELDPPFDKNDDKVLNSAKILKECDVDLLTLSDSPLGRARMDAGLLAVKIQNSVGINVMPHISCRDKNTIALRGAMLGLHANGIENLLIVTGDPVNAADRESIKSVYNFNSIKLMNYIKLMNEEIFESRGLNYGGAINYHGVNKEAICSRIEAKMSAGAKYFLTQPIYSDEDIERICYIKEKTKAKIICGIMPLVSYKNARFIKNEMPGINIPDSIVEEYKEDMTREEFEKTAVRISVEIAEKLYDICDGYYFMTPFNRAGLIKNIITTLNLGHV